MRLLFFIVILVVCSAFLGAEASPVLNLWVDGPLTTVTPGQSVTIQVHRSNTELGLGGLSYNLNLSESSAITGRSYGANGWIANDSFWDSSSPAEGTALGNHTSLYFDTVHNPAGTEFAANTSGLVESVTLTIPDGESRWIYFDVANVFASNSAGLDWRGLGGSINVTPDLRNDVNPHAFGIQVVPEPISLTLLLTGLGFCIFRRKK